MLPMLLRQLLPGSCLLCDGAVGRRPDLDLCPECLAALPWNEPACQRCANPLARHADGPLCSVCRHAPPPFTRTLAPLTYDSFPRRWIARLKDQLGMVEGRILGTLLADAVAAHYAGTAAAGHPTPDIIVPVPLTLRRLARRGHNQALTLARPVARRLGLGIARHTVVRLRPGHRQRGLSRPQRLENPAGMFAARHTWEDTAPCVAIVDDVMTTGATAAELARVLLAAGAGEVHVWCAARTPIRLTRPSPAPGS